MFITRKKGSKNWFLVESKIVNGKTKKIWQSTGTSDKKKAQAVLAEIEANRKLQRNIKDKSRLLKIINERSTFMVDSLYKRKTPIENAWETYLQHERTQDLKKKALDSNKTAFNIFRKWLAQQHPTDFYLEDITYEIALEYTKYLRFERKIADGTFKNYRNALHGIFKRIKRPLGLHENPFDDIETPRRPRRKKHRCFSSDELNKILEYLENYREWKTACLLSYYTGLRFGDCCLFKIENIDFDMKVANVKTGKLERYNQNLFIPLHNQLFREIKEAANNKESGYLLPKMAHSYKKDSSYFSRFFSKVLEACDIDKETSEGIADFHSFRHTFNTNLINAGVDLGTRMNLVGHSNVETNQIYNHAKEAMKDAIKKLPQV